jgi:opacity protein-like surface antigen
MKKILLLASLALALSAQVALADNVKDAPELRNAHQKIQEALKELEHAQKANHYDMGGHAANAEKALREAEHEIAEAVEFVKKDHDKHEKH